MKNYNITLLEQQRRFLGTIQEQREEQRKATEEQGEKQVSALTGNIKKGDDYGLPFRDSNGDSK